jgi:hypothetical protein
MKLPVAALPRVDFPTINVSASLPGANPETMAASVAAPLERAFAPLSRSLLPLLRRHGRQFGCGACHWTGDVRELLLSRPLPPQLHNRWLARRRLAPAVARHCWSLVAAAHLLRHYGALGELLFLLMSLLFCQLQDSIQLPVDGRAAGGMRLERGLQVVNALSDAPVRGRGGRAPLDEPPGVLDLVPARDRIEGASSRSVKGVGVEMTRCASMPAEVKFSRMRDSATDFAPRLQTA